jgi:hypothetical protein
MLERLLEDVWLEKRPSSVCIGLVIMVFLGLKADVRCIFLGFWSGFGIGWIWKFQRRKAVRK